MNIFYLFLSGMLAITSLSARPISVCATVPELGSLVQEVGGEWVDLTVFVSPKDNPHMLEARPSFIKAANRTRLMVFIGLELETAYLPAILQSARNARILPGKDGYLDASDFIKVKGIPSGEVDRSMGDVHPLGDPHYLLDPINGLKVAAAIRDRLGLLEPQAVSDLNRNYREFEKKVHIALVGEELAQRYDVTKLARLMELGKLDDFLKDQNQISRLKGWFGDLLKYQGAKVMEDHKVYGYLASRFGFEIVDQLEPTPGVQPGFKHLGRIVLNSRKMKVRHVLVSPYFPQRLIQFLARNSDLQVIEMAHQMGSRPNSASYLDWLSYNVSSLKKGLLH